MKTWSRAEVFGPQDVPTQTRYGIDGLDEALRAERAAVLEAIDAVSREVREARRGVRKPGLSGERRIK